MSIVRLFVEKKPEHAVAAKKVKADIKNVLGIALEDLRLILRYDIEGLEGEELIKAKSTIFSEPPVDDLTESEVFDLEPGYTVFGAEFLPGQYDQRADSAAQCVQLLTMKQKPLIACAVLYAL
jgi:phosphoribosylformylglycinamidine synthase